MSPPVKQGSGRTAAEVFETLTAAQEDQSLAIADAASPWWFKAPSVLGACARLAVLPLEALVRVAEGLMAAVILGIAAVAWMWWSGHVTDAEVTSWLLPVGERILAMIEKAAG